MRHFARIKSGQLTVTTEQERVSMVDILTFAARNNPKRGFYFVSKVLGRHIPVAPSVFSAYAHQLANLVERCSGPYLVVGLGEAAVGLGGAVAQHLGQRDGELMIYTHTTRQELTGCDAMFSFDEAHSHAPGHLLYAPLPDLKDEYEAAEHLVLVDDEMTTGRTVTELAKKLCRLLPKLKKVTVVSYVSWVQPEQYYLLANELKVSSTFDALITGKHQFEFNSEFNPVLPPRTDSEIGRFYPDHDTGRRGMVLSDMDTTHWEVPLLDINQPVLVLGTVEFSFQPYLLAKKLEDSGFKVNMLCTTRTPIVVGDAIKARFTFDTVHNDPASPVHYLYNMPDGHQVVACFENNHQATHYGLRESISFTPWVMDDAVRQPNSTERATGVTKCA